MATVSDTRSDQDTGGEPPFDDGSGGSEPVDEAPAPSRTCDTCGAPLEPGADWCLACGTAQPGRLGGRPGAKTLIAVTALTLLLFCGAISAGYAALTDDTSRQSAKPSAGSAVPVPSPQADIPAPTGPSGAAAPATPSGAAGPTGSKGKTKTPSLPALPDLPDSSASVPPVVPDVPPLPATPATPATPSTSTPTGSTGTTGTTSTPSTTTTTPTAPTPITLEPSAASIYDPYSRATSQGDPSAAIGSGSGWTVSTPPDGKPMQVGLLINLGSRQTLSRLKFTTSTPGFRVEVYGTDGSATPADILDTRWTKLASKTKIGRDVSLRLHGQGEQTRQLVVWLTKPPPGKATVTVSDVSVAG